MDEIDEAQARQELYLDIALREHFAKSKEGLLMINRKRRCLDCKNPIPQRRIMANPQAVRCIGCQAEVERNHDT